MLIAILLFPWIIGNVPFYPERTVSREIDFKNVKRISFGNNKPGTVIRPDFRYPGIYYAKEKEQETKKQVFPAKKPGRPFIPVHPG